MVKINWTDQALSDLNDIGDYIASDSPKYAALTIERLFNSTDILKHSPLTGRIVPEINKPDIRELIRLSNYRIVYRIVSKIRIDILTVHHTARLIKNNPALSQNK